MTKIRILGLDPSLTATGWVICDIDTTTWQIVDIIEMGTSETAKSKDKKKRVSLDNLHRAQQQRKAMLDAIDLHGCKIACSELPTGAQDAKAATAFGIVIGLIAALPIPVIDVTPTMVKKAACGDNVADKEDIMRWALDMTKRLGGLAFWKTSKRKNDFEIEVGEEYMVKKMEHQADAVAVTQAAIATPEFRAAVAELTHI